MKKRKIINALIIVAVFCISIIPVIAYKKNLHITKYSIPAIFLFVFHLLYGLLAYYLRYKGNFLRFNRLLLKQIVFYFFESNREYTFTEEYKKKFYRMFVVYYSVVPMYIPCIFLTSTVGAMPIALIVFAIPQVLFVLAGCGGVVNSITKENQKNQQLDRERAEQERREKNGQWK